MEQYMLILPQMLAQAGQLVNDKGKKKDFDFEGTVLLLITPLKLLFLS